MLGNDADAHNECLSDLWTYGGFVLRDCSREEVEDAQAIEKMIDDVETAYYRAADDEADVEVDRRSSLKLSF